ncbi:hypothetical protein KKE14_00040 [Patescibacteria group bacterium]|nr:hypothetical protein [Patescibacteria group bacterium]
MKPTLYALKCQKCGGNLKKINSDESYHVYVCIKNACKSIYTRVYIDNRLVEIGSHISSKRSEVPQHCPSCKQPAGASFAPVGFKEVECGACKTKLVHNDATGKWEVVESMGGA